MSGITVACRGLEFGYEPGKRIIRVEDMTLNPGEISVFCGGNGTGKTTLMKVFAGIHTPWSGSLVYRDDEGSEVIRRQALARAVYVHQEPYILKGTVFQNLAFFLPHLRGEDLKRRVARSLKTLGLEGYERKRAATLSGGEKKRLALARALAARKALLFLDEPTANVDASSTGLLIERLQLLKAKGITLVVATHDEDFSRRIADRYYHFAGGVLEEQSVSGRPKGD